MEAVASGRLRVGLFADSAFQPRWMAEALARAAATGFSELALVATEGRGRARLSKMNPAPVLWAMYGRLDRSLFGSGDDWTGRRDVTLLAPKARRIALEGDWRRRATEAKLDVAFVMGDIDDAALEGLARFGVWRFSFNGGQGHRAELAGVREVLDGAQAISSGIRIHRGGGLPDRIACQSWTRTFPFSPARSRDGLFAKTADFLSRALRDLHAGGADWIEHGTEPALPHVPERFPATPGVLRDITTLGMRVARRATEKAFTVDTWSIAYRFCADEAWDGSLEGFHRLEPPNGWYWADPFPIQVNGRNYIFFEELPLGASKAHISVVEVDRDGNASKPVKVLERDYHLSYPFLVEEDGQLYMIPETAHNNTVEIYRCVDFPTRWKLERVLLEDVFCCDATLHREGDKWWMFANAATGGADINDELHLFSADRLLGEWRPHRRNPVKSDARSARPAGRLYRRGDGLYRPGQICTHIYGSGIALHRVTRLTHDEYVEQEVGRIVPKSGSVLGIHTINRAGDLSVADAFSRRPRFQGP